MDNGTKKAEEFNNTICPSELCTGCFACMNKCPKQAIKCIVDSQGRTLPKINEENCIRCGLCKAVCPQLNRIVLNTPQKCYAAQRIEENSRKKSASGGIAAVMTETLISKGSVAFGASTLEGGMIAHIPAENLKEADKFKGSKYVQSYTGYSYKKALQALEVGKKIIYIGTPCQIAGLKSYLGKEYGDLYCVDIICHGVPPMEYLNQHIKKLIGNKKVDALTFRAGEDDYHLRLSNDGQVLCNIGRYKDAYYYSFYKGLIQRENCFKCLYAQMKRCGDITIGDFWGLKRDTLKKKYDGNISLVLVNSEKGKKLFSQIKNQLVWEERTVEEAVDGNIQLREPLSVHYKRETFINEYSITHDFEKALALCKINREMRINRIHHSKIWMLLSRIKHKLF